MRLKADYPTAVVVQRRRPWWRVLLTRLWRRLNVPCDCDECLEVARVASVLDGLKAELDAIEQRQN